MSVCGVRRLTDAGSAPMAKRGQVQLRPIEFPPDGEHVPQPYVVENKNRFGVEAQCLKVGDQLVLQDAVLRCVNENQISVFQDVPVAVKSFPIAQVSNSLRELSALEVFRGQASSRIFTPGNNIKRYQATRR